MTWWYSGQFRIIYSKIMISTGVSAALALLVLLVTAAKAHPNCGYDLGSDEPSAISSGAQIVTYGEPCFCKESLPYSIQVPKSVPTPREERKSYGYSVVAPSHPTGRCLQIPIKIETPIVHKTSHDNLCGKTYGVSVQHQEYTPGPRRHSFDFAVQKLVKVEKPACRPSLSISIQHGEERVNPRFAPLPFAVQKPVEKVPQTIPRLTGLTSTVDRVLVPACEINGCPDCNDIVHRRSHPKPYY